MEDFVCYYNSDPVVEDIQTPDQRFLSGKLLSREDYNALNKQYYEIVLKGRTEAFVKVVHKSLMEHYNPLGLYVQHYVSKDDTDTLHVFRVMPYKKKS